VVQAFPIREELWSSFAVLAGCWEHEDYLQGWQSPASQGYDYHQKVFHQHSFTSRWLFSLFKGRTAYDALFFFSVRITCRVGGVVASWLVRSTPYRAVRVRDIAGDIALCSWARAFTLSTQVYKWVPANLMLGVPWDGLASLPWGSRNIPSRFMLQKPG